MGATATKRSRSEDVRFELERLTRQFGPGWRDADPVRFPHRFAIASDREIAAFFSASLAFGNVKAILASLESLFERLGPRPAHTLVTATPREIRSLARGFRHRWIGESELAVLALAVRCVVREHGTLEAAFVHGDVAGAPTTEAGLEAFSRLVLARVDGTPSRGLKFLLPAPSSGSACKRANLFLRWVARPADGLDLGLWRRVEPRRLIIPLDVHVGFHAQVLGFTRRRQLDWKAACEVTAALRVFDPDDPLRFDFSLCHLGIHGECRKRRVAHVCAACPLDRMCRLPTRGVRR